MFKFILIFIFILILSGAIFFLFWPKNSSQVSNPPKDVLSTVKIRYGDNLSKTKDTIAQNTANSLESMRDNLYDQAQNALNTVFDKQDSEGKLVSVNILAGKPPSEIEKNLYTIDLSSDSNLKIQLSKDSKYYLKFQNVPANYCLYIDDEKYTLDSNKILEVLFQKKGTYFLKTSNCDRFEKNIGEITVQ